MLKEGDKIPSFSVQNSKGETVTNTDLSGKKAVLYFYPKDDTSGCTKEAQNFTDNKPEFDKKEITIYGISKDSVKKHEKFCSKYQFQHELLSDENSSLCEDFGVWKEKSMYGRKYMGIVRSTFLVDESGTIIKVWENVKVPGHVEDVLANC